MVVTPPPTVTGGVEGGRMTEQRLGCEEQLLPSFSSSSVLEDKTLPPVGQGEVVVLEGAVAPPSGERTEPAIRCYIHEFTWQSIQY